MDRLGDILIKSAQLYPQQIAIQDEFTQLTYQELLCKALTIAQEMYNKNIRTGAVSAIYGKKTSEMITAMFACLFLGCPYIPIEGKYPIKRLEYIFKNSNVSVCLFNSSDDFTILNYDHKVIMIDISFLNQEKSLLLDNSFEKLKKIANVYYEHAFTFYTSGSTGIPKGVMISHTNALNFIDWAKKCFNINSSDRVAATSPLHFDLSVFDIFVTLSAGATIFLASDLFKIFPVMFTSWLREQKITVLYLVPTALIKLVKQGKWSAQPSTSLRLILFAGETYPITDLCLLRALYPTIRMANLYGPTETNVCTWYEVPLIRELQKLNVLPIGDSIDNLYIEVIDANGQLLTEIGSEGELYCIGDSVSAGYIKEGKLEIENSKFFQHHDSNGFKTGDLVRLSDKGLIFISRKDRQIKHRGYRIDVHEIEACIRRCESVIDVAVIHNKEKLIAYVIAEKKYGIKDNLIKLCQQYLPSYMFPDEYIFVSEIPKTATEKVNYQALLSYDCI